MKSSIHPLKLSLSIASVLALSACIEVDDDSNDDVAAALQEQNRILNEQLAQSETEKTVTIAGVVVDAFNGQVIQNATITVKTPAATLADAVATTNGRFSVAELPANTSFEILIESLDDAFVSRVFYRETGDTTGGNAVLDLGQLSVSEGETYEITVLDSTSNMPITGLEFSGSSASGNGSSISDFDHVSAFDEVNGVYTITVPKFLNFFVSASIDADRDGVRDFFPEDFNFISGTNISIRVSDLAELEPILLASSQEAPSSVELRISIANDAGIALQSAMVALQDELNDFEVGIDNEGEQYTVNVDYVDGFNLEIPAFSEGDVNYQSTSVSVFKQSESTLRVNVSRFSSYTLPLSDSLDIVVIPRVSSTPVTDLRAVFVSDPNAADDNSLRVFYSVGVDVSPSAVSLFHEDGYEVVKGNASTEDAVLSGTTRIRGDVEVPIDVTSSLNNTKLNVIPSSDLAKDDRYTYSVGAINVIGENQSVDISSDDSINFTSASLVDDSVFDINNLVADNDNYTTNGVAIQSANTAGEAANPNNNSNWVHVFFPSEINQLQQFNMRLISVTQNGTSRDESDDFEIVRNGFIRQSRNNLVSLAQNENTDVRNVTRGFIYGTSLDDAAGIYNLQIFSFLSDNTDSSENSVTLSYAYETKSGEEFSGVITLPIQ